MGCTLNYQNMQGIVLSCNDKPTGGLKSLRFMMLADAPKAATAGKWTVSRAKTKQLIFNKKDEATNFNESTTSQANGSSSTIPTVSVQFNGITKATRDALEQLSNPLVRLVLIAETDDGAFWMLGRSFGMILSEVSSGTGASNGDFNGYNATFTGEETDLAVPVTLTA